MLLFAACLVMHDLRHPRQALSALAAWQKERTVDDFDIANSIDTQLTPTIQDVAMVKCMYTSRIEMRRIN